MGLIYHIVAYGPHRITIFTKNLRALQIDEEVYTQKRTFTIPRRLAGYARLKSIDKKCLNMFDEFKETNLLNARNRK